VIYFLQKKEAANRGGFFRSRFTSAISGTSFQPQRATTMTRGDKSSYPGKQNRQAEHT
jgi:hypothetical protein